MHGAAYYGLEKNNKIISSTVRWCKEVGVFLQIISFEERILHPSCSRAGLSVAWSIQK